MAEKLTEKIAREILDRIDLPASSNLTTVLALENKSTRQNILQDPDHEDREIAAAIEIQRFWRGYQARCDLYDALHPMISLETQSQNSPYNWSDLTSNRSLPGLSSPDAPAISVHFAKTAEFDEQGYAKSSRSKLEESYKKWLGENGMISFEDYCALIIQSWWHQARKKRHSGIPPVRPPTADKNYRSGSSTRHSGSSTATSGALTRKAATILIQRAWRRHIDMQVYHYYRNLICFKFRGDPALLLRCINPKEAELLDTASGTHVKFRLAGEKFPPNIYYKIFTHRPVVDLCASSPKDYTKASAKQLVAKQAHNKDQPLSHEDEKDGWYERWENNGWRLVSNRILRKIDQDTVAYESTQKKIQFKHSRTLRKQDVERKRKMKKILWMKKMYRDGMLWTKQGTEPTIERAIENTVKGIVDITDKLGHSAVEEWEVDELLEWTNGLNFDRYLSDWKEFATSAMSDQMEGKLRFFAEDQFPVTLST